MATKIGYQGWLGAVAGADQTVTSGDELDTVRDVTINLSANEVDDTSRLTDGWRSKLQGLKEWGFTFEMIHDPTNTGFTLVRTAFLNGSALSIKALDIDPATIPGTENADGITGNVFVTGFEKAEPLEEAQVVSVTLVGNGTPTFVTEAGTLV